MNSGITLLRLTGITLPIESIQLALHLQRLLQGLLKTEDQRRTVLND
jgi:hypothetical protein